MKFTIVTPTLNMEKWIEASIKSVLSQSGDFGIEYIIVDGGSNDRTTAIASKYQELIKQKKFPITCKNISLQIIKQSNTTGMYGAINQGFSIATGDVYAWINADDIYEPGAFEIISQAFQQFPEIQWLKGITSTINEKGEKTRLGKCRLYRQDWLATGIYGKEAYFVEQDSVFWKNELWKKVVKIDEKYKLAGDYSLWINFARYSKLWSLNIPLSCFRKRKDQLSKNILRYKKEQTEIRPRKSFLSFRVRLFFSPQSRITNFLPSTEKLFLFIYKILFHYKSEYLIVNNKKLEKKSTYYYQVI